MLYDVLPTVVTLMDNRVSSGIERVLYTTAFLFLGGAAVVTNGIIDEDTRFEGSNFCQAVPHTQVFEIRNGARLVLSEVNAVNVTLPDEMLPGDFTGNNAQIVPTGTGNPERPTINLLHECDKCATFVKAVRQAIEDGAWQAGATIIDVKAVARELREDAEQVEDCLVALEDENMAALAKWSK